MTVFQDKINQFQDRKRQKIQMMKEEIEEKDFKECSFKPNIYTRKQKEGQPRDLRQFLEDQQRY